MVTTVVSWNVARLARADAGIGADGCLRCLVAGGSVWMDQVIIAGC